MFIFYILITHIQLSNAKILCIYIVVSVKTSLNATTNIEKLLSMKNQKKEIKL